MKRPAITASIIALALLCQANGRAQTADSSFEAPPQLAAADLVPANLIQGNGHTLAAAVRLEGYRAIFEIDSPQGQFRAPGRELLSLRIAELPAIENLSRINKGDAFADALAKAAAAPLAFVGTVFSNPAAALGSVASGAGQLVGSAGNVVRSGLERVTDGVTDLASDARNTAGPGEEREAPSFISDPFGYNKARRQWARSLAIDPYTSNPLLRKLLDDAASATFAGSFAVDATLGIVAAPVRFVVGMDTQSQDVVWDLSPGDIELQVEGRLKDMGIEGRPVRDFFRNSRITPTLQNGLAGSLEKLTQVNGRAAILEIAAHMQSEAGIRGMIEALNLLADHHKTVAPVADLRLINSVAVATRKDGSLVAALSADYFYWNATAAEFARRADLAAPRRTLLISGRASPRALQELERLGWTVMDTGLPQAGQATAGR